MSPVPSHGKKLHRTSVPQRILVWGLLAAGFPLVGYRKPPSSSARLSEAETTLPAGIVPQRPRPVYRPLPIQGASWLARRTAEWGEQGTLAFLKVNRVDLRHVRQGDTLVLPEPLTDVLRLSPFPPEIESARSLPKLLLVSRRVQAFAAYQSGTLVHWGPTSTGKHSTPTPTGLFFTTWKSRQRRSTVNEEWLLRWVFNFESREGLSFHQYDLPGYPASHACVRLLEEDARWIYEWADQWTVSRDGRSILAFGTPVIIFGDYAYGKPPPWKRLIEDPQATTIYHEEIEEALGPHLPTIYRRVHARSAVPAIPRSSR